MINTIIRDDEPCERRKSNGLFAFQVIHDLRHPIQAQKSIIDLTLAKIQKRKDQLQPWFQRQTREYKTQKEVSEKIEMLKKSLHEAGFKDLEQSRQSLRSQSRNLDSSNSDKFFAKSFNSRQENNQKFILQNASKFGRSCSEEQSEGSKILRDSNPSIAMKHVKKDN